MTWIKNNLDRTFLLRFGLMVIMIMHGIPSFVEMSVIDFGNALTEVFGFGFMGIPMAILVKGVHVLTIPALLFNRFLKPLAALNIIIFFMGIVLIHWKHGWYVVGGGSEGVEFNFLLIFSFSTFLFPDGLVVNRKQNAAI
jgi:putative oxidoreductase